MWTDLGIERAMDYVVNGHGGEIPDFDSPPIRYPRTVLISRLSAQNATATGDVAVVPFAALPARASAPLD